MNHHIPNIGEKERMKRFRVGIVWYGISLALLTWLILSNANRLWRLSLFFPYLFGGISVFQMIMHTCYRLAWQKKRNMDQGEEDIDDEEECLQLWNQSVELLIWSGLTALILTSISVFIW